VSTGLTKEEVEFKTPKQKEKLVRTEHKNRQGKLNIRRSSKSSSFKD